MLILVLLRPWLYLLKNFHVSTLHTHEYSGRQPSRLAAASCSLSGPSGGALFKNGRRTEARAQLLAGSIEFDQSGIHGSLLLLQHALALRAEGGWPSINAARAAWRHLLFPAATAYSHGDRVALRGSSTHASDLASCCNSDPMAMGRVNLRPAGVAATGTTAYVCSDGRECRMLLIQTRLRSKKQSRIPSIVPC